jgi:hypothetical protein
MHKLSRALSGVLVAVVLAACKDPLTVANTNNPDRLRVLATPADLEAYTSGAFRSMHVGSIGGSDNGIPAQARVMSFENSSTLANWGNAPRGAIPRNFIDNNRGNQVASGNLKDFQLLSRSARSAADGLNRLTLGDLSLGSAAQDARLKAFAWYTLGMSLGRLALVYDSAAVIDPYDDLSFIPPLSSYDVVMAAALADLDSATTWATTAGTAPGSNGFPLPATWINGNALSSADFIRLVRTYKAQFRADVARTPTERAAVNWAQVEADASNGITQDFVITTASSPSWTIGMGQIYLYAQWGQAHQFILGMADSSGGYNTWLTAPYDNKVPFLVVTADRRFPRGLTRAEQRDSSGTTPPNPIQYYRNRISGDSPSDNYGQSFYDLYRFQPWYDQQRIGDNGPPMISKNQNDMLLAEAYLRTGNIPGAVALIDVYRARAGLPTLASGNITALGQAVPGGNACVPRIPVGTGPTWTGSTCGDIWEAMKWEFRMENMFVGYTSWYFPERGWGDLPEGTALHWPVPYQELDTRRLPLYNRGGVGCTDGSCAIGKGTYGL